MTSRRGTPLTRRRFDQVVRAYRPLPIEAFSEGDPRFRVPMHHLLKNRDRFWLALRAAFRFFPPGGDVFGLAAVATPEAGGGVCVPSLSISVLAFGLRSELWLARRRGVCR